MQNNYNPEPQASKDFGVLLDQQGFQPSHNNKLPSPQPAPQAGFPQTPLAQQQAQASFYPEKNCTHPTSQNAYFGGGCGQVGWKENGLDKNDSFYLAKLSEGAQVQAGAGQRPAPAFPSYFFPPKTLCL